MLYQRWIYHCLMVLGGCRLLWTVSATWSRTSPCLVYSFSLFDAANPVCYSSILSIFSVLCLYSLSVFLICLGSISISLYADIPPFFTSFSDIYFLLNEYNINYIVFFWLKKKIDCCYYNLLKRDQLLCSFHFCRLTVDLLPIAKKDKPKNIMQLVHRQIKISFHFGR